MKKDLIITNKDAKALLVKTKKQIEFVKNILEKTNSTLVNSFQYIPFLRERGHDASITSIAITPDGKHIVSGSYDDTIKLWDIENGECIKTLEGHNDWVESVAITPDGKYIISDSHDGTIKIWGIQSGECIKTLEEYSDYITSIDITSDGKHIISGVGWGNAIKIWDIQSGECVKTLERHKYGIDKVVITPDGKYIVFGDGWDKTIKIWDIQSGECIKTLGGHSDSIISIAITSDGKHIVSGSKDKTIKIWDIQSGECIKTLGGHSDSIISIAITSDGKHIVSGSYDDTIKLWDIENGECIKTIDRHGYGVREVTITPDGKHIISEYYKYIEIWHMQNNEELKGINLRGTQYLDHLSIATISPNGKYLIAKLTNEKYDNDHKVVYEIKNGKFLYNIDNVCAITPDNRQIVSSNNDCSIEIRDIQSGECLKTFERGFFGINNSVSITQDGKYIVSGGTDSTIKIWDFQSGECLDILKGYKKAIAIDSDQIILLTQDNAPTIYYIKSGEYFNPFDNSHDMPINFINTTPDGKYIISGSSDGTIKIWDIQRGECIKTLEGHNDWVESVAITPDGKYIVSGSGDGTIKIWYIQSGMCLKTLEGHNCRVESVAITPDGKYIVAGSSDGEDILSGSRDGTIKIWDIQSGICLKTLEAHSDSVKSIAITPDGKYILVNDRDTIKVWHINSEKYVYMAFGYLDNCVSIDKNGYFRGIEKAIDEYIRVSEAPLTQRKLTKDEKKHFRKKGNFLKIGKIFPRLSYESIEILKDDYDIPEIDIDEDEIPF